MQNKTKNWIIVIELILILFAFFIANLISKDQEISLSERRKLEQFPTLSFEEILNGNSMKSFDKYAVDQFVLRDLFKNIKYFFSTNIMFSKDNNSMFINDNSIYKMDYPLNQNNVSSSIDIIKKVIDENLTNSKIYYSIIPDKNYYLKDDHLKLNVQKVEQLFNSKIQNAKYIDIKDSIENKDFYNTDLHWKQENIKEVALTLKDGMNIKNNNISYEEKELGDFAGSYYYQVGKNVPKDTLKYLINDVIENATTYNLETKQYGKIYDLDKYNTSNDKYDVFLSGPVTIMEINNNKASTDKELVIFRDSFGSSLAPLLIDSYKKITLIDLRYASSKIINKFVEFNGQDILFIYSTTVLNQNILK